MTQASVLKADEENVSIAIHWEPDSQVRIERFPSDMVTTIDLSQNEMLSLVMQWFLKTPPEKKGEIRSSIQEAMQKGWL